MNIYTLSRAEVENIRDHFSDDKFGEGAALISIGNPGQDSYTKIEEDLFGGGWPPNLMTLFFHDADPNVEHGQVKGMTLLDNGQVKSIIDFVEKHEPDNLFVQCQAGQSRSCGVAYALHKHYNDGDLKQGWENYNRYVEEKVSEALRGYKKDQEYYNQIFND